MKQKRTVVKSNNNQEIQHQQYQNIIAQNQNMINPQVVAHRC